ncbi:ABC transporter permease [Campylobacter corcagiensis]|uniref:ABC transporter permease n=1 Tax=Campylobacter corcagiensis TaxID=1448857 RepID=A0A7M1LHZ8_9BACT|nr:ABC transporter permease [Campylobacter corcagiensis]QKF64317.1 multidrug resistance ABC transporter, permease protein [Campylobacter corcagiensis]QOQ87496.1 ABC transporter permease [Campylobacter corcagiensis]
MRLAALIIKEFLAIKNDKKSLFLIFVTPFIQLFIFAFAINLDVKNIDIAVLNHSGSDTSLEILRNFKGSNYVRTIKTVKSMDEAKHLIDKKEVIGVVVFGENLENDGVGIFLDGRRSNNAGITLNYLNSIIQNTLNKEENSKLIIRNLYNPNLNNYWWILPNIFGAITLTSSIMLTAMSIAREREIGTFEQILVSPLSSLEILIGKLIPPFLISMIISTLMLGIVFFGFKVPLLGPLWLLYLGVMAFLFSICSIGLFISTISFSQQQATLYAFIFLIPSFLLSGFATAVDNMPSWLIPFTDFISLKFYLSFTKGIFLKDISFFQSLEYILPMIGLGGLSFVMAWLLFKKQTS